MEKGSPGGASDEEPACQCRRHKRRSLGWEDPLEEGTATHSSILAWRIPWTEEPGGLGSIGSQRVGHTEIFTDKRTRNELATAETLGGGGGQQILGSGSQGQGSFMQDFEGGACLEGKLLSCHLGSSHGVPGSLSLSGTFPLWDVAHFPLFESTPSS